MDTLDADEKRKHVYTTESFKTMKILACLVLSKKT